jgi:hypothetical protein
MTSDAFVGADYSKTTLLMQCNARFVLRKNARFEGPAAVAFGFSYERVEESIPNTSSAC